MSTEVLDYSEYMNSCFVTIKNKLFPLFWSRVISSGGRSN